MGLIKEMLIKETEDIFNRMSIFGKSTYEDLFPKESLEEEMFEVIKGNFKTNIICKFTKNGYLVSTSSTCTPLPNSKQAKISKLEELITEAVSNKDFAVAEKFQNQIDKIKTNKGE